MRAKWCRRNPGKIEIGLRRKGENLEIRIADNGPGIADAVRDRLFEPFVSHGKENGTGMGLTVVQKILQDHGGDVVVEQTSAVGNNIPRQYSAESVSGKCSGGPTGNVAAGRGRLVHSRFEFLK